MTEHIDEDESVSNDTTSFDEKLKLMVIGETRVGKTSLIKKYTRDVFGGTYLTTVGIDFQEKTLDIDGKKVRMQLWDTAGEERFRNIAKNYFVQANGFLIVYDISSKDSFEKVNFWYEQIKLNAPKNIKYILVGNKCDLEDIREVQKEDGINLSKEYKCNFFETSAKEGINVNEIFQTLVDNIIKDIKNNGILNRKSYKVLKKNKKQKKKSCC